MRSVLSLGVTAVILLSGCYESRTREGVVLRDGSVVVVGSDAGPSGDAGRRDGGGARRDGGSPICTGDIVAPYEGPPCRPETVDCLSRCEGDSCDDCYARDPECNFCVNATYVRCANELECQALWDEFACCAQRAGCEGARGVELLGCAEACVPELEAYGECATPIFNMSMECSVEVSNRCLP